VWVVGARPEWLSLGLSTTGGPKGERRQASRGGENQQGEPDQLDTPAFFPLPTPHVMTVGPCSQFLFHVSDSSVVMACFKIALCLRL
jgi:hypothetical protein